MNEREQIAYEHGRMNGINSVKEYTLIRRFYAWYGFVNIIIHITAIIVFLIWAHHFINVNL